MSKCQIQIDPPRRTILIDCLGLEACLGTYKHTDISYLCSLRRSTCLNKASASQTDLKWHGPPPQPQGLESAAGPRSPSLQMASEDTCT